MTIAIWLAVAASVFWGLGTAMQKHGMSNEFPAISLARFLADIGTIVKTLAKRPVWVLGLAAMIGGMVCYAYALSRGDITLVQPIVNLTMVVAAMIGVVFLKEKVNPIEWAGIGVMLAGVTLLSMGGGAPTSVEPTTAALLVLTGIFVTFTAATLLAKRIAISLRDELTLSLAAGCMFGLANVMGKVLTQRVMGRAGEFSLASLQCWTAILLDFPVWIIVATNLVGMALSQTAFANGRVSLVSPIMSIVANTSPVLAAIGAFDERVGWARAGGILLAIVGTGMLAGRK